MEIQNSKFKIQNSKSYDVIIIGGGAAGMSAAMWCDELGLSALILERSNELGGQLLWVYNRIENHLGASAKNGRELRDKILKQIENRKFDLLLNAKIREVDLETKKIFLESGETYSARAIIIAAGVRRRTPGIEGEEKFQNKGILHSGKRDVKKVKNKKVVIVGGGDAAIENALILSETASQITVIHRRKDFRAREEFLGKANDNPKVSFLPQTILTKISGGAKIEEIEVKNLETEKISRLSTDAILFRIGVIPNTEIFSEKLSLDKNGYIKINSDCETNIKQVYAVGDIAHPTAPTVSTAVGTGAIAIKTIFVWLNLKQRL